MSEHAEQVLLFQWAALNEGRYPELRLLHAVQNWAGVKGPRDGARRKAEGVKPGVPDVHLPVPRNGYASLYIEMKRRYPRMTKTQGVQYSRTKPTREQEEWIAALREAGNAVEVCWTAAQAQAMVEDYLTGRIKARAA